MRFFDASFFVEEGEEVTPDVSFGGTYYDVALTLATSCDSRSDKIYIHFSTKEQFYDFIRKLNDEAKWS